MHAVTVGQLDLVSGDAPGTASKYVEDSFDGNVVALYRERADGSFERRELALGAFASQPVRLKGNGGFVIVRE